MTRFVRERFPDRQAEILGLYLGDPEFRGLCHDFGVCVEEIERMTGSAASEDTKQRIEQFRQLQRELEADIVERLDSTLTKRQ